MFRRTLLALAATWGFFAVAPASAQTLVEEYTFLPVKISGRAYLLEAMIVRPDAIQGRLPIALISHGKNLAAEDNARKRAVDMVSQARDFAHRGWLAVAVIRRGFGLSDGSQAYGLSCDRQNFRGYFERNADDLAAALEVVAQRPDADPTRAIAVGVSAGGAAAVALAARQPKGLVGVINISGGLQLSKNGMPCAFEPGLIAAFSDFGARTRVPTLWLYAENDRLFSPDLVRRLLAAYTGAGARADLRMFPPMGADGHNLWSMFEGRKEWLVKLDSFLEANALPTWNRSALETTIGAVKIADSSRKVVESYLAAPSEKVLSVSRSSHRAYWWAGGELASMRQKSLEHCEQKSGEACTIMMENFEMIGTDGRASARRSVPSVEIDGSSGNAWPATEL